MYQFNAKCLQETFCTSKSISCMNSNFMLNCLVGLSSKGSDIQNVRQRSFSTIARNALFPSRRQTAYQSRSQRSQFVLRGNRKEKRSKFEEQLNVCFSRCISKD